LDAGLVSGCIDEDHIGQLPNIQRLTWKGHEFLALSRQTAWDKLKKRLADRSLDLPFDVLLALLKAQCPLPAGMLQSRPEPGQILE
jgi:hypothetical protein